MKDAINCDHKLYTFQVFLVLTSFLSENGLSGGLPLTHQSCDWSNHNIIWDIGFWKIGKIIDNKDEFMTWEIVAKKISQLDYMLKLPAFQLPVACYHT